MGASQPNILWICTDQQRFDTLGCTGNPFVDTPNLDRLARDGMLFRNAFCQNPVCTPSRASFLTGRYPRTTRCRQNGQCIPADEILVQDVIESIDSYEAIRRRCVLGLDECSDEAPCPMHDSWKRFRETFLGGIGGLTLAEMGATLQSKRNASPDKKEPATDEA